jgi:hypothetical protein
MLHNYFICFLITWIMVLILAKRTERRHSGKCRSGVKWSGYYKRMLSETSLQNYFFEKSLFT